MTSPLVFDGILFFPVTPFDTHDRVDLDVFAQHVESRVNAGAGAVFPACGTGEFHALSPDEADALTARAVQIVDGRVPVVAGVGGPLPIARELAARAQTAGADALLLLPPYLVAGPTAGLVAYVEAVASASELPIILYHRGSAQYTPDAIRHLTQNPKIVGFKDGTGDVGLAQQLVLAAAESGRSDLHFFNGLLTAELSQGAYRGIGIPLYSSAAFAMIPDVANAYYRAYTTGDEELRQRILAEFYVPLVTLRDETPGFGVSLIKAGLRLGGLPVGPVRAPLFDPSSAQTERLAAILGAGQALADELGSLGAPHTAAAPAAAAPTAAAPTPAAPTASEPALR